MLQNLFRNMGPVVKNILLLNVIMFVIQNVMPELNDNLALHYVNSDQFAPYQILAHFFMHGGIGHLFFNMFAVVIFGSQLERVWGAKKFLLFYGLTALGASLLYMGVQMFEMYQLTGTSFPDISNVTTNSYHSSLNWEIVDQSTFEGIQFGTVVGASGAVFGLLAGYAYLFPNNKLMLLFPPIPIKAKFFVLGYAALELYMGFANNPGDNVAHFAHIGGGLIGLLIVWLWGRSKSNNF
ncbi:MAG: membrane associated rhomboid family serine protease [Parvicellaceae bacterium]|jgi:membrane associated rhomboid family serine protease